MLEARGELDPPASARSAAVADSNEAIKKCTKCFRLPVPNSIGYELSTELWSRVAPATERAREPFVRLINCSLAREAAHKACLRAIQRGSTLPLLHIDCHWAFHSLDLLHKGRVSDAILCFVSGEIL